MDNFTIEIQIGRRLFFSVETAFNEIHRAVEQGIDVRGRAIAREMRNVLQLIAKNLRERHSTPWSPQNQPKSSLSTLMRRSGRGIRSIERSIRTNNPTQTGRVRGQISTALLTTHETGAIITAKKSQFLTIPLPAALTSDGQPLRRRARDWDNTFVARSRRGNLLIFRRIREGDIVPLYLLKRSVEIPKRLGMEEEVLKQLPYFELKALNRIEHEIDRRLTFR